MQLPFDDGEFDAVVCQFGVMFFPDKSKAFSEARRVLRPGGVFLFNAWDRIEENEFAHTVTTALEALFPDDPPRFLARTPHGYHDLAVVERDLRDGGFDAPRRAHSCAAKHGSVPADTRSCVLPGDAVAQRNRGARQVTSRRGNRPCCGSHRTPVRTRPRRRQDPGAHFRRRTLNGKRSLSRGKSSRMQARSGHFCSGD